MKNRLSALVVAVACLTVASGAFATTSSINPAVPAQNSPLSSAVLRSNFQAAYNDITTIFGELVGAAISALTGDITCSGSGSVACTLANTTTARSDIGLGTASIPLFNSLQLSKNVTALPSAQTGTVLQLGNVDGTIGRSECDGFGSSCHFSVVRRDGTNASPTTLQSADEIGSFNAWGYNGTAIIGPQAAVRAFAAQNWSVGANGTYLDFAVTPIGSTTLTEAMVIGNDGGVTVGSPTGGNKGTGTINATGIYVNGTAVSTGGGGAGGSASLSALTSATANNSIENSAFTQTWNWDTITSGSALTLSSTSLTTGALISASVSNSSSTGDAGYFSNTSTSGFAVYANGAIEAALSSGSTQQAPITAIQNGTGTYEAGFNVLAPNLATGAQVYFDIGKSVSANNGFGMAFNYVGAGSSNNYLQINPASAATGLAIYANGHIYINTSTNQPSSTAVADALDISGGMGLTATTSTVPAVGMYAPVSSSMALTTNSTIALEFDSNQHYINSAASNPTCGTGCASITSGSTDVRGSFTTSSSVTSAALAFAHSWGSAPFCVISSSSTASLAAPGTVTTSSLPVNFASSVSGVVVAYHCIQ